ncbi:hypothetical protein F3J02_01265 [Acinetobacter sp. Tr-809]|nr:hypothetical protein [Acinetobacter sp. Tr-809]
MEADLIGLEGGLNPYAYAGSNPVMNMDSSGLAFETLLDASLAAISIKAAYDDTSWQNIAAATYDTAAVFVPFLPAGAGLAVKTTKNADKIKDVAQSYKQERKYWTQGPIIFKNLKVYKRDSLFDPNS